MIQPGATIGMLGGGQLGRMSILAGRHLGYRFQVYQPGARHCACAALSDKVWDAPYDDLNTLRAFAEAVDVVTLEFENIPADAAQAIAEVAPLHPRAEVLSVCQNRLREKLFLQENGFTCAPFEHVTCATELADAVHKLGTPCVLKTADFGYDGKGQVKIHAENQDWEAIWSQLEAPHGVVEAWIRFTGEYSVICARNEQDEVQAFPVFHNVHRNHILHTTQVPCQLPDQVAQAAQQLAQDITRQLQVVGLLTVELFLTEAQEWIVNELAPRPHNSGHLTMDACLTSQFEQHIRAVAGLPLGDPRLHSPAVMCNLLGQAWDRGTPDWSGLLRDPDAKLHLYDKGEPRCNRKMGHYTLVGADPAALLNKVATIEKNR